MVLCFITEWYWLVYIDLCGSLCFFSSSFFFSSLSSVDNSLHKIYGESRESTMLTVKKHVIHYELQSAWHFKQD